MEAARLFFACSVCLMVGAAAGVFGTRLVYGDRQEVRPAPERTAACPPCPETACIPSDPDDVPGTFEDDLEPGPDAPPVPSAEPGLSMGAVRAADQALRRALQPCLSDARSRNVRGTLVLDLGITVTGTTGRVTEAETVRSELDDEAAVDCMVQASLQAAFASPGPDGSGRLKLPVRVD